MISSEASTLANILLAAR